MKLFTGEDQFFSQILDKRFKSRFLAAQFLLLELRTNFEEDQFPSLRYDAFKTISEDHKKSLPQEAFKDCQKYIRFLADSLTNQIGGISTRDWISIYLLISYIHKKQEDLASLKTNFQQFIAEFINTLNMFSIYEETAPPGMDPYVFIKYKEYKQYGRQATSPDSISTRFNFILNEYINSVKFVKFKDVPKPVRKPGEPNPSEVLSAVENALRKFIERELRTVEQEWWKRRVPGDVKTEAEARMDMKDSPFPWYQKSNPQPLDYVDFTHYAKIILKGDNWQDVFGAKCKDKEIMSSKLRELDFLRKMIAHNRPLSTSDKDRLRIIVEDLMAIIKV
jgi:hypothetical protein